MNKKKLIIGELDFDIEIKGGVINNNSDEMLKKILNLKKESEDLTKEIEGINEKWDSFTKRKDELIKEILGEATAFMGGDIFAGKTKKEKERFIAELNATTVAILGKDGEEIE